MKLFYIILSVLFLQSCATSYRCGEFPEGKCQNLSDVYRSSDKEFSEDFTEIKASSTLNQILPPEEGLPIISQPKVLRVLFNKWIDKEGDLRLGGHMFIKIEDSKWQIQ